MTTSHLSLVVGGGNAEAGVEPSLTTPLPGSGTLHLHLHVGSEPRATGEKAQPLGRWAGLLAGIALVAAFGGGYQLGRRPAPDDVSNLRPPPIAEYTVPRAPAGFVPPSPRGADELPAVMQQLQQPPRIIPPQAPAPRALPRPSAAPVAPGASAPSHNSFGLEN
ncbi:hypothetical protein [Roseomonas mucosa]|uniref:hypothetical protein n=1 Tax=Roseomonas mucosa TaxID=207340 RepID=UPI0022481DFE|nr:hypothetical protein [Roseomonas mucosa]UZO94710.1 Hypothetical protein RMP42_05872 [Roseomonas mucosa]